MAACQTRASRRVAAVAAMVFPVSAALVGFERPLPDAAPSVLTSPALFVPTERCEALPRTIMRARLTIASGELGGVARQVEERVQQIWGAEGVRLEWVDARRIEDVDVWVAALPRLDTREQGQVLGFVQFAGSAPLKLIRLSIEAIESWVLRYKAMQLHASTFALSLTAPSVPEFPQAIAYVAAHELGHYLLGSRRHERAGLMREVYDRPDLLTRSREWQLDVRSRRTLALRIRDSQTCDGARGAGR